MKRSIFRLGSTTLLLLSSLLTIACSSAPRRLKAAGNPIDLEIFPNADHGILEFEEKDGRRVFTRYAPGYFELESEWVRRQAGAGS